MTTIKPITKQEVKYLRENKMGEYVQNGHGTYHRYLVVESKFVLDKLEEYRKSVTLK